MPSKSLLISDDDSIFERTHVNNALAENPVDTADRDKQLIKSTHEAGFSTQCYIDRVFNMDHKEGRLMVIKR